MTINESQEGKTRIFDLSGRLDASTSDRLEEQLLSVIDGGASHVVVDLDKLEYISSAGLRVLLLAAKKLKQVDGKIVLSNLQAHIREVFDIAGFSAIFSIFNSRSEAIEECS